jgi:ATP-binding cassette subfamily B protein
MNTEFAVQLDWQSDRRTPLRWIASHALRNRLIILILFVGAFGNAALAAVVPVYVGQAFDAVLASPPDFSVVANAALVIVISQIVRGVLQFGRNFGSEVIGQRLERDTRAELYTSLIGKSMTFHDLQSTGDVMARATNDVREVNLMLNPGVNLVIGSAMFLAMPVIFAPGLHPQLFITPLLFCVAYFFALRQFLAQLRPVTENVRRRFGGMNAILAETIEGIETVKGAAKEEYEIARFEEGATEYRDAFVQQGDIEARFLPLLLMGLTFGLGLLHALALYRLGEIGVGDIVAFMGLLFLFGFPTFVSLFAYAQISSGMAGARRILELIRAETALDENKTGYAAAMRGAIRFDDVTFSYRGDAPALENVSFRVEPGQTVAVVGQTGSGKSTIAKLINRTYDASAGRVAVDGVDVRDWTMESLRSQISIIEQDLFLFSRTIAENIAFGCPGATREEIERAAREAQAHEFVMSFADGYETVVGERGVTLSGGQRQRIALARAFLTDPRILILDDSTSAIDSATEDQIQRAIERASQNRTTILITHRLSQIRWADLILVMRLGRVAAVGTHDELMRTSEPYRRIFAKYE